jgi:hypothetical protein
VHVVLVLSSHMDCTMSLWWPEYWGGLISGVKLHYKLESGLNSLISGVNLHYKVESGLNTGVASFQV